MRSLFLTIYFILAASGAFAADATNKIDFTAPILDPLGEPYQECAKWEEPATSQSKCLKPVPLTLGTLALAGLTLQEPVTQPGLPGLSGTEQAKRQQLGLRIYDQKNAEVGPDDIVLICDQIAKIHYRGIATLRAWQMVCPSRLKAAGN